MAEQLGRMGRGGDAGPGLGPGPGAGAGGRPPPQGGARLPALTGAGQGFSGGFNAAPAARVDRQPALSGGFGAPQPVPAQPPVVLGPRAPSPRGDGAGDYGEENRSDNVPGGSGLSSVESRVAAKLAGMGGTGGRDGGRRQAVDANLGIAGERADSLHRGAGELATATGRRGGTGEDEVFSAFDDTHTLVPRKHVDRPDDYWTMNHLKLLYLISKYSHFAQTAQDKEQWVRKLPLLVLVYEGIVQKVFDYDYAPASRSVEHKRVYLNITQEGTDDLDDLVESKLVKGLRLATKEHQSVTAYQISPLGLNMVSKRLPDEEKGLVDALITEDAALLQVVWEDGRFLMRNDTISRESTITDTEDVSYVCSPYIPRSLRRPGGPLMSNNAHRASESATKESTIRDDLDEVITISNVTIMVGEWVPFGANQVVELNMKLGANERCQGGYFTAQVDRDSTSTQFEVPAGLTSVQVLDFDMTRFTNIEAQVYYPEEEGIIQIEQFGIHCRLDGTCLFGLTIESVLDRILENISLDNLARLLVDIHIDSSKIMDSILSNHQRDLLDMVFLGNTENRDKINIILADRVTPKMAAKKYMDKDAFENELRQVLGDTYEAHDLSDDDVCVIGSHGILLAGPNSKRNEPVLLAFLSLQARGIFVQNVFARLFIVSDTLKNTRVMISSYEKDPNSIPRIRRTLSETAKDIILLEEILLYLYESIDADNSIYDKPADRTGQQIYIALKISETIADLKVRIQDMQKILESNRHEVDGLRQMTDTVSETQMFKLQEEIRGSSSDILNQLKMAERQSTSLDVMQVIFAGSLAFEMLDRLTGEWTVVHTSWARDYIVRPLMSKPMVWFLISLGMWFVVGFGVLQLLRNLNDKTSGIITARVKVNKPIDLTALDHYLSRKPIMTEDGDADKLTTNQKVVWIERDAAKWEGYEPKIEMIYDAKYGFLLSVYISITRRASVPARMRPDTMKLRFFTELQEFGVLRPEDSAEIIEATRQALPEEEKVGKAAYDDALSFLKVKKPEETFFREIPFGIQTYVGLRDEIARKFAVKPLTVQKIYKEPDILVADDDDVIRLLPGTVLEAIIRTV